jgi:virulence factor Mce-like protein
MGARPAGPGRILVAVLFSLSCIGLLLFLWTSFGGTVPLQAKRYRATLVLPDASNVVKETDVRISGVSIGSVVKTRRVGTTTQAVLQIEPRYAPLRRDVRAVLRRKSLLGEAYLELAPGQPTAAPVPDGGMIPARQVREEVAVDKVLSTFDPRTRRALKGWLRDFDTGLRGRSGELSGAVGRLPAAAQTSDDLLSELRRQRSAVSTLVRDTGVTFQTIGSQQADVDRLITNSRDLFATTAASDRGLRRTVAALPGFLDGLNASSTAVSRVSRPLTPVVQALRPAARRLPATLTAATAAGVRLRAIAKPLDAVTRAAPRGLDAARQIVDAAGPLLSQLRPLARQLVPMVQFATVYRQELVQSWLQTAAATNAVAPDAAGTNIHYLRAPAIFPNEAMIGAGRKAPYARSNPYMAPLGIDELAKGELKTFDCSNVDNPQTTPPLVLPAPACRQQDKVTVAGRTSQYPQLRPAP